MFKLSSYHPKTKTALLVLTPTAVALAGYAVWRWKYAKGSSAPSPEHKDDNDNKGQEVPKPRDCKGLKEAGNKLFKEGKYVEALDLYSQAIDSCTEEELLGQLYQNRAAVWERLSDHNAVIKETTAALAINPKYVKALFRRGKAYKLTGFLNEALADVTCVCILENFATPTSVQMADDLLKDLGAAEAQKIIKDREGTDKGVKPSPHTCSSYLRGFYNCPVSKLLRETDDEFKSEIAEGPYAKAIQAVRAQNYDKIEDLCNAQMAGGDYLVLETRYLRGTFRFLYGHRDALEDYQYVVRNSCDRVEYKASALIKMASHYALLENVDECEKCFDESEKLWSDNVDLFHHRGQVLLTRAMLAEALDQMSKAADLQPNYAMAVATKYYVQYRIISNSNDIPGADACLREFEKLLRKFPESPDVVSLYGQILMENQRFPEAEEQFARVMELDKNNAAVVVHRAMSKFQCTGDIQEAIHMLKDAVKTDSRNEFVYETLGTLYLQTGDLESAIENIGKAVELARSLQELTILCSLRKAAEVQKNVKDTIGLSVPPGVFR